MRSLEICAGAGGQALGLEQAGFQHIALVEIEQTACATLRRNRPWWNVVECDVKRFSAKDCWNVDLLAGGVPCPPFSVAGKQLGDDDERDLFPEALRLVAECCPKAVMIENVRGIFNTKFDEYRESIRNQIECMGYTCFWESVNAARYGVSQHRPRAILVALGDEYAGGFAWPHANIEPPPPVGQLLVEEMASCGWRGAGAWSQRANGIAPTLVGGSTRHGGADLGPTRARVAWAHLGVDGSSVADAPPAPDFVGSPKLTVKMAALLQGFPSDWVFVGRKTQAYRQVGNAFPPPVARAVGHAIRRALQGQKQAISSHSQRHGAQESLWAHT